MSDKIFPKPSVDTNTWPWVVKPSAEMVKKNIVFPKISVITSSYNQSQFLEETIRSVLLQNYPNLEYIIIDGGSNDGSVNIIRKYEQWLTYWVSEKDQGCADALNKGIELATGDYYYYLNSDDYLLENVFSKFSKFVQNNPGFDVYYGHGQVKDEINNLYYNIYSNLWSLQQYLSGQVTLVQQGTFINLDFIKKNNVRFNLKNRSCWDGELVVDLSLYGSTFVRMPFHYNFATFRLHSASITGAQTIAKKYREDLDRIYLNILTQKPNLKKVGLFQSRLITLIRDPKIFFLRLIPKIKNILFS